MPLVLAGDWNGFNKGDANLPWKLTRVTAPDLQGTQDAYNWFTNTIHVATSGGDTTPGTHSFALIGASSYSVPWGGVIIKIDSTTDIPFFSGTALGPTNTISFEDGFYYSMRILEADLDALPDSKLKLAVMKASAPPVLVNRTGQTPAVPAPDDPVIVSIGLNQPKSVEERIYLRWTTDSFITCHLIEAKGSGPSYSATIPPQPAGTLVLYTVISSTADLAAYSASSVIDSLILETAAVFNASPSLPTPTPTPTPDGVPEITQQPANTRVRVGRRAKFQVTASGAPPLSYQWRENGAVIAGATKSRYTTPLRLKRTAGVSSRWW